MRYTKDRKEHTRHKILLSACRRFAAQGFDATSIDEIMRDCNLTRGGFYAHFKSKGELYRDPILLATAQHRPERRDEDDWVARLLAEYLESDRTAFLAKDIASEAVEVRRAYEGAFIALNDQISARVAAHSTSNKASVRALTSMIVGTLAVVSTVESAELKESLLQACKEGARALLEPTVAATTFFWEPPTAVERARFRARFSV